MAFKMNPRGYQPETFGFHGKSLEVIFRQNNTHNFFQIILTTIQSLKK